MRILLTGGAGYIASHTAVELIKNGHEVVIADNFANSSLKAIERVGEITGRPVENADSVLDAKAGVIRYYVADVSDNKALDRIFKENKIDACVHFAAHKAVGESVREPLKYYRNNIDSTLTLLECMRENGVKNVIFSSSATVYGEEGEAPFVEDMKSGGCTNPYGWTKFMMEQVFKDAAKADEDFSVVLLRYFNPVGAHESGLIGEDPKGVPANLMPFVSKVAIGELECLTVFGDDYPTPDGTARRDYIHVMDLAEGHVKAVEYAAHHKGCEIFNLGTGVPYSVLDMVKAFEEVNGVKVNYKIGARREGDVADCWADAGKAERILGWKAERGLKDMCRDSWNWQRKNPRGYRD